MGWFTPECPIHKIDKSIGTDGLVEFWYCKKCRAKRIKEREAAEREKENERKIHDMEQRIKDLESQLKNQNKTNENGN